MIPDGLALCDTPETSSANKPDPVVGPLSLRSDRNACGGHPGTPVSETDRVAADDRAPESSDPIPWR